MYKYHHYTAEQKQLINSFEEDGGLKANKKNG